MAIGAQKKQVKNYFLTAAFKRECPWNNNKNSNFEASKFDGVNTSENHIILRGRPHMISDFWVGR